MKFLVLSCSHNPESRSREFSRIAFARLQARSAEATRLDLRTFSLPFRDGAEAHPHPQVQEVAAQMSAADGLSVATPVYNFDVNAAAKNLLELTGSSWAGKVVGFLCAAGGESSYMSLMSFANSLMLDFRCFILPRHVYAPDAERDDADFGEAPITKRIDALASELIRVTTALSSPVAT